MVQRKLNIHIYFTPGQFICEIEAGPTRGIKAGGTQVSRGGLIRIDAWGQSQSDPCKEGGLGARLRAELPDQLGDTWLSSQAEKGKGALGGFLGNCSNELNVQCCPNLIKRLTNWYEYGDWSMISSLYLKSERESLIVIALGFPPHQNCIIVRVLS